ncbi:MAG: NUDIX domain-containing protein [Chloroflexi bacterium]|nr:MAG: NUDIX domain-containing protein [Chloroflexota bacterium]
MRTKRAAGVLLFREKPTCQFLLMKHPERWDLPKGHQDDGETDVQTALREMWEETGIDPKAVRLDPSFRFVTSYNVTYPEYGDEVFHKTLVIFLGWLQGDAEVNVTEHGGYQWFAWQPPHQFHNPTIDPLLAQVEAYFKAGEIKSCDIN